MQEEDTLTAYFKAAALQVTQLYKEAQRQRTQTFEDGYAQGLNDVLRFLSVSGISLASSSSGHQPAFSPHPPAASGKHPAAAHPPPTHSVASPAVIPAIATAVSHTDSPSIPPQCPRPALSDMDSTSTVTLDGGDAAASATAAAVPVYLAVTLQDIETFFRSKPSITSDSGVDPLAPLLAKLTTPPNPSGVVLFNNDAPPAPPAFTFTAQPTSVAVSATPSTTTHHHHPRRPHHHTRSHRIFSTKQSTGPYNTSLFDAISGLGIDGTAAVNNSTHAAANEGFGGLFFGDAGNGLFGSAAGLNMGANGPPGGGGGARLRGGVQGLSLASPTDDDGDDMAVAGDHVPPGPNPRKRRWAPSQPSPVLGAGAMGGPGGTRNAFMMGLGAGAGVAGTGMGPGVTNVIGPNGVGAVGGNGMRMFGGSPRRGADGAADTGTEAMMRMQMQGQQQRDHQMQMEFSDGGEYGYQTEPPKKRGRREERMSE
ncbi:hypothetical protein HK101_010619 [Irineochytrium annulatum]|nr:hypothetical protein HK101_010619 [Irineochytrium annulatum]